jgi:hypothetical protein
MPYATAVVLIFSLFASSSCSTGERDDPNRPIGDASVTDASVTDDQGSSFADLAREAGPPP